ncbi:TIGR02453 family protein [Streptoalloteichus tenebrarius]|uniref:TIGR02453 family protein n=1 Tax=Streptoalloteichus tenebrarius (strain ATCC 17920 / DSM 40477 / JCM 4838 / CBS 697.72 / NBRC 16177 / NCIMB 11028 / NRRL B-12390 / A12253. 1 / ISP 5477) TaxID=1933 RepID=A0ABT1I318_STRSD|nr:DUF2461 domain-containing protein [Streptoalloteichus tenebrarius]MCP2262159.1 TIGR02453 family protein [Streptoalloteichus tenebrarius]BFF00038.1 DUF2461 domain-containing protein [Streptoalloteichus tenebrarius]
MAFDGFGERLVDFYEGLTADNSKAYWTDNRVVYQEHVREPMEALLADLADEFGPGKVFRPYRDVRFARDKSPYKTHCGAIVGAGAGQGMLYVEVSADGMLVAGGFYVDDAALVSRFREAVADERRGEDLRRRLARLERAGWRRGGNQLRSRPRGVPADHPRIDLLRHRTLYAERDWPPDDVLHSPECVDRVRKAWRAVRPLNDWVADHVGTTVG